MLLIIHVGASYMHSTHTLFSNTYNQNISHGHKSARSLLFNPKNNIVLVAAFISFLINPFFSQANASTPINEAIQLQKSINKKSAASQGRVNKLADETVRLKSQYRELLLKIESTRSYNDYLQKLVDAHKDKKQSLNEQLTQVDDTSHSILPLMTRMIDTLEKFIALDIPFLLSKRQKEVQKLKDLIHETSITVGEKYRRIMEAYQRELAYGNTIGTYMGTLQEGDDKTVEFLRVGRIGLFYQTLDGNKQKYWNNNNRSWDELPSEFENSLLKARRIANKQLAPDLFSLPVQPAKYTQ